MTGPTRRKGLLRVTCAAALALGVIAACQQLIGLEPGELRPPGTTSTTDTASGGAGGIGGQTGSGGHAAGSGGGGGAPAPVAVVLAQGFSPSLIATDGANVYWTNEGSGADPTSNNVARVPVDGGPADKVILADNQGSPVGIGVLDGFVYWAAEDWGEIRYAPTGSDAGTWAFLADNLSAPYGLAIGGQHVVWSEVGGNRIALAPPGGSTEPLATGPAEPARLRLIATADGYAYWIGMNDTMVRRVLLDGSTTVEDVAADELDTAGQPRAIVATATRVYWTNPSAGTVNSADTTAIPPVTTKTTLASAQSGPRIGMAVDGAHLYWANMGTISSPDAGSWDGAIMRCDISACEPEVVAPEQAAPKGIALDANNVYWANWGDGTVMKLQKQP
jgi:hypothetical protein